MRDFLRTQGGEFFIGDRGRKRFDAVDVFFTLIERFVLAAEVWHLLQHQARRGVFIGCEPQFRMNLLRLLHVTHERLGH